MIFVLSGISGINKNICRYAAILKANSLFSSLSNLRIILLEQNLSGDNDQESYVTDGLDHTWLIFLGE